MDRLEIADVNFEHFHMGDLLGMAFKHPQVEVVGICDEQPARMADTIRSFSVPSDQVFTDFRPCLEQTRPDLVILCPAAARHGEWVEQVAPYGAHMLVEKPFAASLAEADRMIEAAQKARCRLAINWPLAWYPSHCTAKRLMDEGRIGDVLEVHYYDGNRGPLWHSADKVERTAEQVAKEKPQSWFYKKSHGGGSLLDYLGYGTTLGTWFMNGRKPLEVTCIVTNQRGWKSMNTASPLHGMSRVFRNLKPVGERLPILGRINRSLGAASCWSVPRGTISSYDYMEHIHLQASDCPEGKDVAVNVLEPPMEDPIQYFVEVVRQEGELEGPLSIGISRIGQQIVDTAALSAEQRCPVALVE